MKIRFLCFAGVAFFAMAMPAHADPITDFLVAALINWGVVGSTLAAAEAAWVTISGVLYLSAAFSLSELASIFQSDRQRQASVTTVQIGEQPRSAIFGETGVAGKFVNGFNYGGKHDTDWEVLIFDLADHYCDGLTGLYVNDKYVSFAGDGIVDGYDGKLKVYFRHGAADQTFPSDIAAQCDFVTSKYLVGVCYGVVAYKYDTSVFPGGRPKIIWVVRGAHCYDPRKDSTVEGGSGTHRWSDPSTWEYTKNTIVCRYNWARGIYACNRVDQPAQLLIGRGLSSVEAPPERIVAWANICDEDIGVRYLFSRLADDIDDGAAAFYLPRNDGLAAGVSVKIGRDLANQESVTVKSVTASTAGYRIGISGNFAYDHVAGESAEWEASAVNPVTQKRYEISGVVKADQPWYEVDEMFAAACAGQLVQPEGGIEVEPGYAKTPVAVITDDDLVASAPFEFSDFQPDSSTVNTVIPHYVEPAQLYQDHSAPVRRSTDDITEDGYPREQTVSLLLIDDCARAGRIGEITRRLSRLARTAKITLPPIYAGIEEGDWIYFTSRRTKGVPVEFCVRGYSLGSDWRNTLALKETASTAYEYDYATDELPLTGGLLSSADPPEAIVATGVTFAPVSVSGSDGSATPGVGVSADTVDDAAITGYVVRYRVKGTTVWSYAYGETVDGASTTINAAFSSSTTYEAQFMYSTAGGRSSDWSEIQEFTTTKTAVSAEVSQLLSDLTGAASAAAGTGVDLTAQLVALQDIVSTALLEQGASSYTQYQRLSDRLSLSDAQASASIEQVRTVAVSATEAVADLTTTVAANYDTLSSTVSSEAQTRTSADAALSTRIDTVTATAGSNSAAISSEAQTRASADAALSTRIDTVTAAAGSNSAAISSEAQARATADNTLGTRIDTVESKYLTTATASTTYLSQTTAAATYATASALQTVSSTLGNLSASGYLRAWTTATSPDGSAATVGLAAVASSGSTSAAAALLLHAASDGTSYAAVRAGSFYVQNSAGANVLAINSDGTLNVANVISRGTLTDVAHFDCNSSNLGTLSTGTMADLPDTSSSIALDDDTTYVLLEDATENISADGVGSILSFSVIFYIHNISSGTSYVMTLEGGQSVDGAMAWTNIGVVNSFFLSTVKDKMTGLLLQGYAKPEYSKFRICAKASSSQLHIIKLSGYRLTANF